MNKENLDLVRETTKLVVGGATSVGAYEIIHNIGKAYSISPKRKPLIGVCCMAANLFLSLAVGDFVSGYAEGKVDSIFPKIKEEEPVEIEEEEAENGEG